jgi:hypothetical protein
MSDLVMAAHQPNFLPYLGFFDKMARADVFVIRDEVLFSKADYHHRNRIRINDGSDGHQSKWLTIPVEDTGDYLAHVSIKRDVQQKKKFWNELMRHEIEVHYAKAPHFKEFFPGVRDILQSPDSGLVNFNLRFIRLLADSFGIKTPIVMASNLKLKPEHYVESDASDDLARISKAVGATIYLSGAGGKGYLNHAPFDSQRIGVEYQDFHHPEYAQRYPGFLPNMASIDALFCAGPEILHLEKNKLERRVAAA